MFRLNANSEKIASSIGYSELTVQLDGIPIQLTQRKPREKESIEQIDEHGLLGRFLSMPEVL